MAEERAELVGGPFCGRTTTPRSLPFVWVGSRAVSGQPAVTAYEKGGVNRALYRRLLNGRKYIFVGYRYAVCEGCETPQERTAGGGCVICGAKLIPA